MPCASLRSDIRCVAIYSHWVSTKLGRGHTTTVSETESRPRRRQEAGARPYGGSREQVLRRLARMEGQVRGVARMIERDQDCVDVLQQTAALRAAVDSVSMLLMEDHVRGCVIEAVRASEADELTGRVMEVVRRGMGRPSRPSRASSEP
jgi:CsoR family transcriptional regulator, copper-sensing transcriptional repressor